jgi:hypothetical protein
LPGQIAGAGEVTILCDDFDGIVLLPDFGRFKRIFESDQPNKQVADWKELVWTYIKNPDIPIVAFERVAEQYPLRVEKVMRSLIRDKQFSLEHLYAVLLHYKQPVDGLEDLKDDQDLWDLFNGNASPSKSSGAKVKSPGKTKTAKKPRAKAAARESAKNSAVTRAGAPSSRLKRKPPGVKRRSKPAAERSGQSPRALTRKTASARKR